MMNNLFSTPEFPNFPIEEFESELEQEHAEFKSAIQKLTQKLLAQFKDQNPELMDAQITKLNDIAISITLERKQPDGIKLEYHKQIQDIATKDIYSEIEKALGRPVTSAELTFSPASIPLSEFKKVDQIRENYELAVAKGWLNHYITFIDENIPKCQTIRPDISIDLYLPSRRGSRMFIYAESNGIVLIDDIFKLPTVTLDTSVVIEWWNNQAKVEHVETLIELGKKFEIDLAVTGRIHDDVPKQPLAAKINDLPNLLIDEIGAVIRINNWKPGTDTVGITEFVNFIGSIETSDKFNNMNKKRPGSHDWDHIHTHYRYGRNYFLTWDGGILHFQKKFEEFGIKVMKPEDYLSQHQALDFEGWVEETMCTSLQTDTSEGV